MPRKKTVQDLQKQQEKLEQELKIKQQNLKALKKQSAELQRRERTHRLCIHGAMLEQYLSPDEFTTEPALPDSLFQSQMANLQSLHIQ